MKIIIFNRPANHSLIFHSHTQFILNLKINIKISS